MPVNTAQIIVGQRHPNDDGINWGYGPPPTLVLSEGDRPAWRIEGGQSAIRRAKNLETPLPRHLRRPVIIPTLESPLEEALAFMVALIFRQENLHQPMDDFSEMILAKGSVGMYDLSPQFRQDLLHSTKRLAPVMPTVAINIFAGDSLALRDVDCLSSYEDYVLTKPVESKRRPTGWDLVRSERLSTRPE